MNSRPHRRRNALTGDSVLVSPQRALRPWQGQQDAPAAPASEHYRQDCYLCPGNKRSNGDTNPDYPDTFVFANDFPALLTGSDADEHASTPLFQRESVNGECRVVCFSPRHDLTLARMTDEGIAKVLQCLGDETLVLSERYQWVQAFENRGAMMGCSSPHPHGQIWAMDHLPTEAEKEHLQQQKYFADSGKPLLLDYVEQEIATETRLVVCNEDWAALVPYWAAWPFETLLLPRFPVSQLYQLSPQQRHSLASVLRRLLVRYDNLFQCDFPYSMGWHQAPQHHSEQTYWQLHAHFYPPLLRSASVRKFMVGFEMLGEAQRDITPEQAAERLRNVSEIHYSLAL